ncbi:TPR repeat-containing protein [Desulfovibrio sp. X2]|uniref:tetratricopeptide repeat protein n=1 Tax=Desulfovibrio sp. X2 TaxID=941449 RepID=UPI000358A220|nr:tetratricopeptide repeat protein [Desulfovibrio sp. X2]EPR41604.1 TPR repeat-containing protein [Desulfovibrio sp. X2]
MSTHPFPEILGVYSLQKTSEIGTGGTASRQHQVTYWYARRLDEQRFEVQPLNVHHVPSGLRKEVPELEFLKNYVPEPDYYNRHTVPALATLARKIEQGEKFFSMNKLDDAEREFLKALMIDESNVRANFGLGEVYSEKKDFVKLKKVLDTLLGLDEAFHFEQRTRFNSFGISLRKNGHLEESLRYYRKALEYNDRDEHMYFNIARVYFDKGERNKCCELLSAALEINPGFEEAQRFLRFCSRDCAGQGA